MNLCERFGVGRRTGKTNKVRLNKVRQEKQKVLAVIVLINESVIQSEVVADFMSNNRLPRFRRLRPAPVI